jgi:hypothetical protein
VLGATAQPADVAALRQAVELWHLRYHTLMTRALPVEPWGPGRLDAVAMIFNRLSGLDLGKPPGYLIPENIQPAEAPVRYPFLWNAAVQDQTQWPGFADNGSPVLGLARNLGEVYVVFATFHPRKNNWRILGIGRRETFPVALRPAPPVVPLDPACRQHQLAAFRLRLGRVQRPRVG